MLKALTCKKSKTTWSLKAGLLLIMKVPAAVSLVMTNVTKVMKSTLPSGQDLSNEELLVDDIVKLAFYSFLIIFAVFGNSFVLFVLYRKRKQFNFWRVNLFIFHLALGDMLVALTSMPTNLIYASTNGAWLFGNTPCKVILNIQAYNSNHFNFLFELSNN